MNRNAIRIRTKIVKDTFVEENKNIWERVTKNIVITAYDDSTDLMKLHDKIAIALSD